MSLLDQIEKPKDRMPIITILGDSGMGKTSLAATFPNPIFIRVEDGMQSIALANRPDAMPIIESNDHLRQQLCSLIKEEHNYKTVVIDSVTKLEGMFIDHVVNTDPKKPKSINQALGGYGAGLSAVAALHASVRRAAGVLNNMGICVVFIAHADTETIELPDEDSYMRYSLRLGKRSIAPYVDESDVVGFLKLETFTTGEGDRKKAISDGTRVLVAHAVAANVSKNRYGITEELPVLIGQNPLIPFIPGLQEIK